MLGTGVTAETTEIDESSCPHGTGSSLESVSKIKKETVQFLKYFFWPHDVAYGISVP